MIRPPFGERAKAATARSISPASRTLTGLTSTLSDGATAWMTPNWPVPEPWAGSRRTATRVTPGAISLSSSSHFPPMLYSKSMNPVALPPGRARLSTKPAPTGSPATGNTIGTVRVACSNGGHGRVASGQDDVRRERDQFRRVSADFAGIGRGPADVDAHIAADGSSPIAPAPAGTPRRGPEIPHRPRLRAGARRCAASARAAARARRAATQTAAPPRA